MPFPGDIRYAGAAAAAVNIPQGKGNERPIATRGPGAKGKGKDIGKDIGKDAGGKGKDKGFFKGKDKSNVHRTNPGLPAGAMGADNIDWLNEEHLSATIRDPMFPDNPDNLRLVREVACHLARIVPARPISNQAMFDSSVNCAVVYTGLPWNSPEVYCLQDIMTFGNILTIGHPGIHYVQLNKNDEGVNTGAAFIGWVNRELAIASIMMYNGYRGNAGTAIQAMENRNGNPLRHSHSRRHGNPRCNEDVWQFPEPLDSEMGHRQSPFGAPTFVHTWFQLIEPGLIRST
jgi:hypothetical protein